MVSSNTLSVNGTTVTATPATATQQYTYAFQDWSGVPEQVTGDVTITANFTQTTNTYTVTIVSNNDGYGSVNPTIVTNVPYGTVITQNDNTLGINGTTVTATPASATAQYSYIFDNWSGIPDEVTENVTITANFTQTTNTYTVTVSPNPSNGGSVYIGNNQGTTEYTFNYGEQCVIHATANPGYVFQNWMKNGTVFNNNPNCHFDVTETTICIANFTEQGTTYYTIQTNVSPQGAGTVTGSGTHPAGSTVTLEAIPNNGYAFDHWQDGSQTNPRTITVNGDATYTAFFTQNTYTINTSVTPQGSGTVSGAGTYHYGDTPTLTADPNEDYTFAHWQDGNTQNPRTITVTGNATYTATFNEVTTTYYTVSANVSPSGAGTVSGTGTFPEGTTITLNATANNGYSFDQWDDGSTQNPRTVTVTGNITYTAYFNRLQYTITANVSPANSGTVTGGGTYYYNATCNLHAEANEGYEFQNWKRNGSVVSTEPDYSFNVTGNATYTAYFGDADYFYITTNNTIFGTRYPMLPETGNVPASMRQAAPSP